MPLSSLPSPLMVFDIETIPDLITGKRLYPELANLADGDVLTALQAIRREEAGNEFMQLPLHQVACLSFLWIENGQFTLRTLSQETHTEDQILSIFMRAFAKKPTLISWNGAGFDIPVLLYRLTHHQLSGQALLGGRNDYMGRYANKHIDLMLQFGFEAWGNKQKLDVVASLCGFAGKGNIDGSQVVPMVQDGQWQQLGTYCESDVINTWLIYVRYLVLTGKIGVEQSNLLISQTKQFLSTQVNADGSPRHAEFL